MILRYTFNVEAEVMVDRYYSCEDIEPDYETKEIEVDYDYSVEPSFDDYWDWVCIPGFSDWTKEQREASKQTFKALYDQELLANLESLEEDDDFVDFMKERYEEDARRECESEYEN